MESHAGRDGKLSAQLNPNALITFLSSAAFSLFILFFLFSYFSFFSICFLFTFFFLYLSSTSFSCIFLPFVLLSASLSSLHFRPTFFYIHCDILYASLHLLQLFFLTYLSAEMDCGSHGDKMCR